MKVLLRLLLVCGVLCTQAFAQTAAPESGGQPNDPAQANQSDSASQSPDSGNAGEPIAPYDDKLLRLSEILGSVHYLRTLCGAKEGNKWRATMSGILAAENPGPKRRARLIAHFNRGYRTFSGTYSACTASAILAAERYMQEGAEISKHITNRYGR